MVHEDTSERIRVKHVALFCKGNNRVERRAIRGSQIFIKEVASLQLVLSVPLPPLPIVVYPVCDVIFLHLTLFSYHRLRHTWNTVDRRLYLHWLRSLDAERFQEKLLCWVIFISVYWRLVVNLWWLLRGCVFSLYCASLCRGIYLDHISRVVYARLKL